MNPLSPPARPHIGIHLTSFPSTEWGEDDAWDSASDSESPRQSTIHRPTASTTITAPKRVPRKSSNLSSSTLAFSYTHVQAPSPGSYPPKGEPASSSPDAPKNGWTMIRTSPSKGGSDKKLESLSSQRDHDLDAEGESGDIDVEGDMILGDLEPEGHTNEAQASVSVPPSHHKAKQNEGSIRHDIDDIVTG